MSRYSDSLNTSTQWLSTPKGIAGVMPVYDKDVFGARTQCTGLRQATLWDRFKVMFWGKEKHAQHAEVIANFLLYQIANENHRFGLGADNYKTLNQIKTKVIQLQTPIQHIDFDDLPEYTDNPSTHQLERSGWNVALRDNLLEKDAGLQIQDCHIIPAWAPSQRMQTDEDVWDSDVAPDFFPQNVLYHRQNPDGSVTEHLLTCVQRHNNDEADYRYSDEDDPSFDTVITMTPKTIAKCPSNLEITFSDGSKRLWALENGQWRTQNEQTQRWSNCASPFQQIHYARPEEACATGVYTKSPQSIQEKIDTLRQKKVGDYPEAREVARIQQEINTIEYMDVSQLTKEDRMNNAVALYQLNEQLQDAKKAYLTVAKADRQRILRLEAELSRAKMVEARAARPIENRLAPAVPTPTHVLRTTPVRPHTPQQTHMMSQRDAMQAYLRLTSGVTQRPVIVHPMEEQVQQTALKFLQDDYAQLERDIASYERRYDNDITGTNELSTLKSRLRNLERAILHNEVQLDTRSLRTRLQQFSEE